MTYNTEYMSAFDTQNRPLSVGMSDDMSDKHTSNSYNSYWKDSRYYDGGSGRSAYKSFRDKPSIKEGSSDAPRRAIDPTMFDVHLQDSDDPPTPVNQKYGSPGIVEDVSPQVVIPPAWGVPPKSLFADAYTAMFKGKGRANMDESLIDAYIANHRNTIDSDSNLDTENRQSLEGALN